MEAASIRYSLYDSDGNPDHYGLSALLPKFESHLVQN